MSGQILGTSSLAGRIRRGDPQARTTPFLLEYVARTGPEYCTKQFRRVMASKGPFNSAIPERRRWPSAA